MDFVILSVISMGVVIGGLCATFRFGNSPRRTQKMFESIR